MLVANYLKNRWVHSGYVMKAALAISALPVAVWGASTAEATVMCALRSLHSLLSFDAKTRSDRWEWAQLHGWDAVAGGALTLVSFVPLIGTFPSYNAIFKMASNHTFNTWKLLALHQKVNSKVADGLYQELLAWEPNVEQLMHFATKVEEPTQQDFDNVTNKLRGSLMGRSWVYTASFHLIEGSCKAVRIGAIRVKRVITAVIRLITAGHIIRAVRHTFITVGKGVYQEAVYARDLASQPRRAHVAKESIRELSHDDVFLMLQACDTEKERQDLRLGITQVGRLRKFAVMNDIAKQSADGPLPQGAPNDFYHKVGMLLKACGCPKALTAKYILDEKYFKPIFPYLDKFDMRWLKKMPADEKQNLIWGLSTKLPNLGEVCLDMTGIDARWQMLIAAQLAQHAPKLHTVTFIGADTRTVDIMHRFVGWRCKITNS